MDDNRVERLVEACFRLNVACSFGALMGKKAAVLGFSAVDCQQGLARTHFKHYSCAFAMTSAQVSCFSPSRKLRLVLAEDSTRSLYWEIWNSQRLLQTKPLSKIHSSLANHPVFGKIVWSEDEEFVLYIADPILGKSSTSLYEDILGDELEHLKAPQIYKFHIPSNEITIVPTLADAYPSSPCINPARHEFLYISYPKQPFNVGIRALINRESRLILATETSSEEIALSSRFRGAFCPKFNSTGELAVFYGVPSDSLGHSMCLCLLLLSLKTREVSVIIDIIEDNNEIFNGIYGFQDILLQLTWVTEESIAFVTQHNASIVIFVTDLNGKLFSLDLGIESPSTSNILDSYESTLLVKVSNVKTPEKIFIVSFLNNLYQCELLEDAYVTPFTPDELCVQQALSSTEIIRIRHDISQNSSILYKNPLSKWLLVSIHGGPHSQCYSEYLPNSSIRLALGFSFIEVNYRGSTGFGERSRCMLLGKVGSVDVEDCVEAIEKAKLLLSPDKIVIYGKSMGGFLSAHLAAKLNPDASVVLNAVGNIASMALNTDMNEWPFHLALAAEAEYPPSPEAVLKMYQISPIAELGNVKCPIFLAAGGKDLRVTPNNTIELYRILKHLGKEVEFRWYKDDGHALGIKSTVIDLLTNSFKWILEKIN